MTDKNTLKFTVPCDDKENMRRILRTVFDALQEKGYNPINQIVGYLLTEDPTYITNYNSWIVTSFCRNWCGAIWPDPSPPSGFCHGKSRFFHKETISYSLRLTKSKPTPAHPSLLPSSVNVPGCIDTMVTKCYNFTTFR